MAATNIYPIHGQKGKSIRQVLKRCYDYYTNPEKTDNKKYVSCYRCGLDSAVDEFLSVKNIYQLNTGRTRPAGKDVIGYGIRQSFKPGEITPEVANKIGYELALELTQGQHQFIVATHIDKDHFHNHIFFNSNALDCEHKFNNYKNSFQTVRNISDRICVEHGVSIIEPQEQKGEKYKEWLEKKNGTSWKAKLKNKIDFTIPTCKTFDEFLGAMRNAGYEIKIQNKNISFRAVDQDRYTRLRKLGADYTEAAIKERIAINPINQKKCDDGQKINSLIDLQEKLQQGKGKGYEHWAKLFNLKQAAKTINYLIENNITDFNLLEQKTNDTQKSFQAVSKKIKKLEKQMNDITKLKTQIINYVKTKNTYVEYKKARNPDAYRSNHEGEILLHEAAKKVFDGRKNKKLPTVKELQSDYERLLEEKQSIYEEYKILKQKLIEQQKINQNIKTILNSSLPLSKQKRINSKSHQEQNSEK